MKKILVLICSIGALMACNREELTGPSASERPIEGNEAITETVPVHLHINGLNVKTRALTDCGFESNITNATLTVKGYKNTSSYYTFMNKYELDGKSDVIIHIKACDYALITVESGPRDESGTYLTNLETQIDGFYSNGEITLTWDEMQNQEQTFNIELERKINKVTVEKISVDWENPNYYNLDLKIKGIYLCDVPRELKTDYSSDKISGFSVGYTGEIPAPNILNFNGRSQYEYSSTSTSHFLVVNERLDELLLDDVDYTLTKDNPYTTKHTFYGYISNTLKTRPQPITGSGFSYSFYTAMTTLVIEAELGSQMMYYRYPILQYESDSQAPAVPVNTHFKFREISLKRLGSPSLYGGEGFESLQLDMVDWVEEDISRDNINN